MKEETGVLGLATIRENRGISLEQISSSTKIGVRTLEAIERGDFRKLPGGIYSTSYIRQYARAIDYDEGAILAVYDQAMAGGNANESRPGSGGNGNYTGFRPASTTVGS
jgi:cytoskeleton protein RodZ